MNILNKLTVKHLKMNKKRTVVTIIGVVLSTAMMVGIGLLLSTVRDNSIKEVIASNGSQHVIFNDVESKKQNLILLNNEVSKTKISSLVGYAKINSINEYKPYLKVLNVDDNYLKYLKLLEGKLPTNKDEIVISNHIESNGGVKYKVGDKISLEVGNRYFEGEKLGSDQIWYFDKEQLKDTVKTEYTIVGIVDRDVHESYSDTGFSVFTKKDFIDTDKLNIFVEYKNVKDAYSMSENIGKNLGFNNEQMSNNLNHNSSLLMLYGSSSYGNFTSSMTSILTIMLILVSIGCIVVIYNSFAISVMERKKQFGLFASIGTTRKQLKKTVFFEATIIGLIGIPIGIISSYIGIGTVISIINALLPDVFRSPLQLATYPVFLIIPIIFMLVVIYLSAFIPSRRASRVTPIEAIRQNDDIKIKGKIKNRKLISKLFKVEGEIAHKNMQRNKKKYRITTASLVISIVLFISFSAFLEYILYGTDMYTAMPDYDIVLNYSLRSGAESADETLKSIVNHEQVKESASYNTYNTAIKIDKEMYTKEFTEFISNNGYIVAGNYAFIIVLKNSDYDNYLKKLGKTEVKPIVYMPYRDIVYKDNTRKAYEFDKYDEVKPIDLCSLVGEKDNYTYDCYSTVSDYYFSDINFLGSFDYSYSVDPTIIIRESDKNKYIKDLEQINSVTYINTDDNSILDDFITDKIGENKYINYYNILKEMQLMKNLVLVVKILVYGFISLVTLIGVTSVFNTISTSIALRRKEFAMLRSMGLTPKGFNKIIRFESIFIGLRALIIGIPLSLVVTFLLHLSMNGMVVSSLMIPWVSIIITILGVFLIVLISMTYSVKKIKKENILDAIREENI